MDRTDASTGVERVRVVGQLVGHAGEYGVVTALSRAVGVSRPTLYAWREKGERAVQAAFAPLAAPVAPLTELLIPEQGDKVQTDRLLVALQ